MKAREWLDSVHEAEPFLGSESETPAEEIHSFIDPKALLLYSK
jgi:hypothetical protein